jgi:hypothetical protein
MEIESEWYFTDSSAVLGMLTWDLATYLEFVGTRVSEIKIKSDPEKNWFWIPGELNLADMGRRSTVVPKDMGPGIPYQDGLLWMKDPPEMWPAKNTFMQPPLEEWWRDVLSMVSTARVILSLWYPPTGQHSRQARARLWIRVYLPG